MNKLRILLCSVIAMLSFVGGNVAKAQGSFNVDLSSLPGTEINDDADIFSDVDSKPTDNNSKMFFLYNVGLKRVLAAGATWGTQGILSPVGLIVWIHKAGNGKYYLQTGLTTSKDNGNQQGYVFFKNENDNRGVSGGSIYTDNQGAAMKNGLFIDGNKNEGSWTFTPVTGYAEGQHVYMLSTVDVGNTTRHIGALPNYQSKGFDLVDSYYDDNNPNGEPNQHWKLISLADYEKLFNLTTAELNQPLVATFLVKDPSFQVNNTDLTSWKVSGNTQGFRFGVGSVYKTVQGMGGNSYQNYNGSIQRQYGAYYYAYTNSLANQDLYQTVKVDRAGWYILRCNGFTTDRAYLYAEEVDGDGENASVLNENTVGQQLNVINADTISWLKGPVANNTNTAVNAGRLFFSGQYVNQVMIYVPENTGGYIRFGIRVTPPTENASSAPWTAVDNFNLLYAGAPTDSPDLMLDENDETLEHLTHTTDEYKNSTLHLNRTFKLGKWNTIILPVTLTKYQVQSAFGTDVMVARLFRLTNNSIQYLTVEPATDDSPMIRAFAPYIIKPTKEPGLTAAYTGTLNSTIDPNWHRTDKAKKTVPANHYVIPYVTLIRDSLGNMNTKTNYLDQNNWESLCTYTSSNAVSGGSMVAKGSMGRNYTEQTNADNTVTREIIEGRDSHEGDYVMIDGNLYKVPTGKKYGLKAFRIWFEYPNSTATANSLSFIIDGKEQETTGIVDIDYLDNITDRSTIASQRKGIYNLNGQLISRDINKESLPAGIYIVNGKKVIVEK